MKSEFFSRLVLGLPVSNLNPNSLLKRITLDVEQQIKSSFTYATAASCLRYLNDPDFRLAANKFSLIHPDGIGVLMALRFLYPNEGWNRMTGSDFYPLLIEKAIEKQWSLFIFGDTKETLRRIPERYPSLRIVGMSPGFDFSERLSEEISSLKPDLVLVGLGVPKQEIWISQNWAELPDAVYLAVGEGLRVLSGTKKRGGAIIQKAGLEWAVRLLTDPIRLWKRYLVWMPVFLFMVVIQKFRGKSE